jgi:hypothetical protein
MSKATDTEEVSFLFEPGTLRSVPRKRPEPDTPEAKQAREEKLAQRETERRARSEKIFNSEWWTRKQAENWVATLDKYSLERRRGAILYEPDGSLQDANSTRSFGTAVSDGLVKEYPKESHGDAQYSSAQVKAAFPEVGQQVTPNPTVEEVKAEPFKPATRGRKPMIDEGTLRSAVFKLLDKEGDIRGDRPGWRTQTDLVIKTRALLERQKFKPDKIPKETQLKGYVRKYRLEWLEKQRGR